jgi:hypothetical protein
MPHRTTKSNTALVQTQDEIPTVRPPSGWHRIELPPSQQLRMPANDGLWQLVCDVMRAEADEALWGKRR